MNEKVSATINKFQIKVAHRSEFLEARRVFPRGAASLLDSTASFFGSFFGPLPVSAFADSD